MANLFEEESQEQLRAKWHEERAKGIGGSNVASVLGISPYVSPYQLWLEKTRRVQPEDISGKFHVLRGVQAEPIARALFEEQTGMRFEPKSWVHPEKPWRRANDDGYNKDFGAVIEIKTMSKQKHADVANGIIPEYYLCQLQYNMSLANANIGYFISYSPEQKTLYSVTVQPDLEYQQKIFEAVDSFWLNHVVADVPPELTDEDFVSCIDPDFEAASEEYKKLKTEMKLLQEKLDMVETVLHGFLGNNSGIKQNGLTISRVVRKGNIEYGRIEALKGIDLEPYRKPSTTYIKIGTTNS